jgi:hypothetical protein
MRNVLLGLVVLCGACGKDSGSSGGGGGGGGGGGRGSEAALQLRSIEKKAKMSHAEKGAFPTGNSGLTPAKDCCSSGGKCTTPESAWTGPWRALGFHIDEPHAYQYSYESDGKTFTAKAVGCGDNAGTHTVSGHTEAGNVVVQYTE